MSVPNLQQICDDIADTLGVSTGINKYQSVDEITEDYQDFPLLQVYPEEGETDSFTGGSQTTFRGGSRTSELLIYADLICSQRSHIGQDLAKVIDMIGNVEVVLSAQDIKPYFGNLQIKGFHWTWKRTNFSKGDTIVYPGVRFSLQLKVF